MYDIIIIGGGIIGLSMAKALKEKDPLLDIAIIEKENEIASHASGRNSGVLHAGFYYDKDSLKAKFSKIGNREIQAFCDKFELKINKCGKIIVAKNQDELKGLKELKKRADINKVDLFWIDKKELEKKYPYIKTTEKALYSPTTATIDPKELCLKISYFLQNQGVNILTNTKYLKRVDDNTIATTQGYIKYKKLINCAGLYADKIANDFGFAKDYTIIPFKGIYLKDSENQSKLTTNLYPVPNLKNPFLGVHFTYAVDKSAKIGPTAIPAFWRENYKRFENFSISEMVNILYYEIKLFFTNAFGFRDLSIQEIKKYNKWYLTELTKSMIRDMNLDKFDKWTTPGIRAQLLDKRTLELVQDFKVEGDENSIHILNAISPALTSAFPFTRWIVKQYL